VIERRGAELVHCRPRDLHLGLDAGDPLDTTTGCVLGHVVQQCCLADAGLTVDYEGAALPSAYGLD
jgi:hypothetical protein